MASSDDFLDQPRQIIAAVLVVAAVVAGFSLLYFFGGVLFSLFVGVVLATALQPIIEALQRRGLRQPVAVTVVYAWVSLFLIVVIVGGAPPAIQGVRELAHAIPGASQQAEQWLAGAGDALWAKVARRIVTGLSTSPFQVQAEQSLATVGQTASYLETLAEGLLTVGAVVLLAFYWSLQGDRTIRWLLLLVPLAKRDGARAAIAQIEEKLGAYIRGQGLVCLAMAGMAAVIYSFLGLRHALLLALLAGLLELMPVLGPVLGAIPPVGVAIFTDPGKTTWVLVAAVLMQQCEGYLIVPRIMDKSVGVHPMVTLLAIAAFGSLLGIAGAILAIPLAAIVQVLLNRYVLVPATTEHEQPSGRGPLSVLRYDAQKLLTDIKLRDKAEPAAGKLGQLAETIEAIARDLDERLKKCEDPGTAEGEL